MITISHLDKKFREGFQALTDINLTFNKGEIFALLGPNGAGKTTLISIICGITNPTSGTITIEGKDVFKDYRQLRSRIGLVPQELTTDMFEKVITTVRFSRNLFGKKNDDKKIEKILRDLSLWDKKDNRIMTLSGGMKRRVMIAKALSHEPEIIFLDEPTAGVDVKLRKEMWAMVKELKASGKTIILTTHYIEEAQEMADRIGIINKGKIVLVEEKKELLKKLGKKELIVTLKDGTEIKSGERNFHEFLKDLEDKKIEYSDLRTKESSLEDIFVQIVGEQK